MLIFNMIQKLTAFSVLFWFTIGHAADIQSVSSLQTLCMQTLLAHPEQYKPELVSHHIQHDMERLSELPHFERLHKTYTQLRDKHQKLLNEAQKLGRIMGTQHRQDAHITEEEIEFEVENFKKKRGYNLKGFDLNNPKFNTKKHVMSLTDQAIQKAAKKRKKHLDLMQRIAIINRTYPIPYPIL